MGFHDIFLDFAGWTMAHGVPRIKGAANNAWRVFWIIVTITCTVMLIYMVQMNVAKYLSYGVSLTPTYKFSTISFPAVTIANLNSYSNDLTVANALVPKPFANMDNDYNLQMSIIAGHPDSLTCSSQWNAWGINFTSDFVSLQSISRTDISFATADILPKTTRLGYSATQAFGSLIISCVYDGVPCSTSDWSPINNFFYANAYGFNYNGSYVSVRAGPANGLRVMFRVDQYEYQSWVESAGIRVVTHSASEFNFLTSFGYYASVGMSTQIAMKTTARIRLSAPYGDCTDTAGSRSYYYPLRYTVEGCARSCIQDAVVKACGCYHPSYFYVTSPTIPMCSFSNTANYTCATNTENTFNPTTCDCPQRCNKQTTSVTISTSKWPGPRYTPSQCQPTQTPFVSANSVPYWTASHTSDCIQWFSTNTGIVSVYYETLDVRTLQETTAYSLLAMITDFGGQFGLWIGGSVVVVVEVLSFVILVILFLISKSLRCYRNHKLKKVQPMQEESKSVKTDEKSMKNPEVYEDGKNLTPTPPIAE